MTATSYQASTVDVDAATLAEHLFRHDHWDVPQAILRATFQHRARVAVKACHSSSKSFTAADAVLLALILGGDAITTAPTWAQVKDVLWQHIRTAVRQALLPEGEWGVVNRTEIRLPTGEVALGLSTNEGVRFQGHHARPGAFLLIVLDEAPGVRADVYEAVEGIRAGGDVRILALGNPTVPSGPFYDAFTADRAGWQTFTIDALATPNFADELRPGHQLTLEALLTLPLERLDYAPRPYLTTRRWALEKYHEWGERSAPWQSRVRGQFPDQSEDSLLSLRWLEDAQYRAGDDAGEWEAGVDVAGPGEDETVVCVRQGSTIRHLQAWGSADSRGDVLAALDAYRDRLMRVKVDSIGQGYYFARHLEDHGWAGRVVDVNVGEAPRDGTDETGKLYKERFANLKADLYWSLRVRAQQGELAGLTDSATLAQLASIRYGHTATGKVAIERKEDARKRGVKSPDRAEAVMLAYAPLDMQRAGVWWA